MNTEITLADLARAVGGWPIRIDDVADLLDRADTLLADKGGRDYKGPLTEAEVSALGFEVAR